MFDEEIMKPERLTEAPENAGIDPGTMRVSEWYQEPPREDDDPYLPSSSRVSDVWQLWLFSFVRLTNSSPHNSHADDGEKTTERPLVRDLAHIPTATADNLITAVKTGRLVDVDIHPDFRTLMQHTALLSTWCKTFLHTREKEVFFLNALKISLAPTPQEGPFQVMFVVDSAAKEAK